MSTQDTWEVRAPGCIGIVHTQLEIYHDAELIYKMRWRGQDVPGHGYYLILSSAKTAAVHYLQELLEMGWDP